LGLREARGPPDPTGASTVVSRPVVRGGAEKRIFVVKITYSTAASEQPV
jgi:hypothetical protein